MASAKRASDPPIDWRADQKETIRAVARVLVDLPTIEITGPMFRAVFAEYLLRDDGAKPEPLYYQGSLSGRRYTPRLGPAGLYLGLDPSTLPAELRTIVFEHGFPVDAKEHDPIVTVSVRAHVTRVLDLTDPTIRKALNLTEGMLVSNWEDEMDEYLAGRAPMPATQLLALTAHLTGLFAGIKYPSARTSFGKNLVVFPDRLEPARDDHLQVVDSKHRFDQRLPP